MIAFSTKGISQQYIAPSGQAVNEDVYISKCLVRLEKFIEKHHKNDNIVFWPDLASSHYSRKCEAGVFKRFFLLIFKSVFLSSGNRGIGCWCWVVLEGWVYNLVRMPLGSV